MKQALFAKLEAIAGPDTILASNTSSIPITAIASACKHPERVGGMHFFNPVPLMRLVEIIPGLKTAPWVRDAMMTIGRRMTREPVLCTDSPAFLVNHVGRAFVPEAQRLLTENIAGVADIDRILTGAPGFKLGPFSLADLVGIDVQHGVMESVYDAVLRRADVCAVPALGAARAGGPAGAEDRRRLVRLRQRQEDRTAVRAGAGRAPQPRVGAPQRQPAELQAPLIDILKRAGADLESGDKPSKDALIIVTPVGWDLTTAIVDLKLDARAHGCRRRAVRHEGPAHPDGDARHRSRHARCRARACLPPTGRVRWSSTTAPASWRSAWSP